MPYVKFVKFASFPSGNYDAGKVYNITDVKLIEALKADNAIEEIQKQDVEKVSKPSFDTMDKPK